MAAQKFIALVQGKLQEIYATIVSAGGPNAGAIPALDNTGKLDISVMPVGVSQQVIPAVASEAITAGSFVNIYNNAGVLNVRNADNTTNGKPAHGFILASVANGSTATVYTLGAANTQLTGLTPGTDYWLGTAGGVTATAPSASGNIVQFLGRADSATSMVFANENTVQVG